MTIFDSNKTKKIRKILLWALVVSLSVTALACSVSFALFTSSLQAQRTIAAYDTEGDRFSSNYLLDRVTKDNVRTVFTTSLLSPASTVVTVCNYPQGHQTLTHPDDMSYTVTARLVRFDDSTETKYFPVDAAYIASEGLTDYTVTITDDTTTYTLGSTTLSAVFSGTLISGGAQSDPFTFSFSTGFAADKPNLYLEIVAEPNNNTLPTLRGVFIPDLRAQGAADYWTGSFRDDSSLAPSAYDGFNYLVSGTGNGTVTLTWDDTKVILSDLSRSMLLSIAGASQTGSSITFPVDSDIEARYDLQFYKVSITSETWVQMNSDVVAFSFS